MNDLKNALSRAFKEAAPESYGGFWQAVVYNDTSNDHYDLNGLVNADKLAQAITDHFSKVWVVGLYSDYTAFFRSKAKAEAYLAAAIEADAGNYEADWWWMDEVIIHDDEAADRLIEGLTGKAGE